MNGERLASAATGRRLAIARVTLDADQAAWLAAVGLRAGESLVILRRAWFGGPLHVRTASGGEFAVGREVAAEIWVEPCAEETP